METDHVTAEVSAALARTRRRARYLEEATGLGPWSHLVSAGISVIVGSWLIVSSDSDLSLGTVGLIVVFSSIGGWQYHRLTTRVNALTKLLAEVGYPGEA
jgi:hypothetical protein